MNPLFSRALFESAGFILEIMIGANVGFILATIYWGLKVGEP